MGYNADGQRARYTVTMSGTATLDERFQYRDGALAQMAVMTATLNSDGSIKSTGSYTDTYVYNADGQPLELLRQQGGVTNRYWYEEDGRGNVVALTDVNGAVVDQYDPWGAPLALANPYAHLYEQVPRPLRYRGYWYDGWDNSLGTMPALGWYWLDARPYDPRLRHFLQPDPSTQGGLPDYSYVNNDPLDVSDPHGLDGAVRAAKLHRRPGAARALQRRRPQLPARRAQRRVRVGPGGARSPPEPAGAGHRGSGAVARGWLARTRRRAEAVGGVRPRHPLMAPAVRPPVMKRWKTRNSTMMGTLLMRLAPISWFQ